MSRRHVFVSQVIEDLDRQLARAQALLSSVDDELLRRHPPRGGWSMIECLQHIVLTNQAILTAMAAKAPRRDAAGDLDTHVAPNRVTRLFLWVLEPPVRWLRVKSLPAVVPDYVPDARQVLADLEATHRQLTRLMRSLSSAEVNTIRFPDLFNPRFSHSLGVGMLIIAAHERRHLWQAEQARAALTGGGAS
jgi:hypothetical protein